ncbi:MAG: dienelactone hydrolase family protein [Candidatus Brocadiia bacterium]
MTAEQSEENIVKIDAHGAELEGNLLIPEEAEGIVLFAHGSGSSRHSPRNKKVARDLRDRGLATLLFDLLTAEEDKVDRVTREHRFDIPKLADRLSGATDWLEQQPEAEALHFGYFGSSTGSAAALIAAAKGPERIDAVVSRGGRVDMAEKALPEVQAPTLMIVGGRDPQVRKLNEQAQSQLECECRLEIVEGATHLFEEPGALDEVARVAGDWFVEHLTENES